MSASTYKDPSIDSVQQATWYSYVQPGNVKTLWQQVKDLELKQIEYQYDLVNGKVNTVRYKVLPNKTDKFYCGYAYAACNHGDQLRIR